MLSNLRGISFVVRLGLASTSSTGNKSYVLGPIIGTVCCFTNCLNTLKLAAF
jgi:hypothetical protein